MIDYVLGTSCVEIKYHTAIFIMIFEAEAWLQFKSTEIVEEAEAHENDASLGKEMRRPSSARLISEFLRVDWLGKSEAITSQPRLKCSFLDVQHQTKKK